MHTFRQYLEIATATGALSRLHCVHFPEPIVVGAVGGSGSRLVTAMLEAAGVLMSPYVNQARDSLLWPPLPRLLESAAARANDRATIVGNALRALEELLLIHSRLSGQGVPVGWKVPASFFWLPEMADYFTGLRYIHVMRHPLDMAYSDNQLQFLGWAWYFGINAYETGETPVAKVPPARMLDYWIAANRLVLEQAPRLLGERFYLLDYDALCRQPQAQSSQLLEFLQLPCASVAPAALADLVRAPASIGRYQERDWQRDFSAAQLRAVEEFGYSV
jgi:hypothetical protein